MYRDNLMRKWQYVYDTSVYFHVLLYEMHVYVRNSPISDLCFRKEQSYTFNFLVIYDHNVVFISECTF